MSYQHKHDWAISSTGFDHDLRCFEVEWRCIKRGCGGTRTQQIKLRKPAATARTDAELAERKHEQTRNRVTYSMGGWPDEVDNEFMQIIGRA